MSRSTPTMLRTRGRREQRSARRASDPVWAGQADAVQVSAWSGHAVRDLRLHFVNTTGTATAVDRLRKAVRGVVAGAASAIRSLVGDDAGAQTAQPAIVSREDWGGAGCPPRAEPVLRRGEIRIHPSHGERERVRAGGLRRDGARYLPLPPQLEPLERRRLQLPGRPLRDDLRGPGGRHRRGCGGRAGAGIQQPVDRHREHRHVQHRRSDRGGAARDRTTPRLEAGGARRAGSRTRVGGVGGWLDEPLPGRVATLLRAHLRPPRRQRHRVPGQRPVRASSSGCAGWWTPARPAPPRRPRPAPRDATSPTARRPCSRSALASAGSPLAGKRVDVQLLGRLGWRTQHSVSTDATRDGPDAGADGLQPHPPRPLRRRRRPAAVQLAAGRDRGTTAGGGLGRRAIRGAWRADPGHRDRGTPQDARRADASSDRRRSGGLVLVSRRTVRAAIRAAAHDAEDTAAGPLPGAAVGSPRCAQPGGALAGRRPSGFARRDYVASARAPAPRLTAVQALPAEQHARRRTRMRRSRRSDQCSMYQRSSSIRSCHGSAARPVTCAQPVMPGSTARRPSWRGVYCSTCARTVGRGPTRLMLARQHVHEVRQLVQREAAQQRARARDARIPLVHRQPRPHPLRSAHHRAQLQQLEVARRRVPPGAGGRSGSRDSRGGSPRRPERAAVAASRSSAPRLQTSSTRFTARATRGRGSGGIGLSDALPLPGRGRAAAQQVPQAGRQRRCHQHVVAAQRRQPWAPDSAPASSASCAASVTM